MSAATRHDTSGRSTRSLGVALGANAGLAVVQLVGGLAFGSLALVADAAHQAADVAALVVALLATRLAVRPPSRRNTFGWGRLDLVGAQASALLLIGSSAWIAWDAIDRLGGSRSIDGAGVLLLALAGVAVNGVSALVLARTDEPGLSVRAAIVHLVGDAAGSLGVLVAAVAVLVAGATWVDGVVALALCAALVLTAAGLLRASTRILLDAAPRGVDPRSVAVTLASAPGVGAVHHLHVWSRTGQSVAVSAHVVLEGAHSLHEAQHRTDELRRLLAERHGVREATLQVECHECEDPEHAPRR